MQAKHGTVWLMLVSLIACKPSAQASSQMGAAPSSSATTASKRVAVDDHRSTVPSAASNEAEEGYCGTGNPHPIDVRLERESAVTGGVTAEIREAQGNAYAAWDKELNAEYAKLKSALPAKDQEILRRSQRAWLAFMAEEEKLWWSESLYGDSGTLGPIEVSSLGTQMVKDRTCQMKKYRERIEYELSHGIGTKGQ